VKNPGQNYPGFLEEYASVIENLPSFLFPPFEKSS